MSVFERYLSALQAHVTEHGHCPNRVYVSPATAARLVYEASALRTQDVPPLGTHPADFVGWAGGCEWRTDATMGDGFRFERTAAEVGA